jgi:anti-anti-sigma regulatory factor
MSENQLAYSIASKFDFVVVSLTGCISKETCGVLDALLTELAAQDAHRVILNFQAVDRVEHGGIPGFVRFQKTIRDQPATKLRLCSIQKDIQKQLIEAGSVRGSEVVRSLPEALQSLGAEITNTNLKAPSKAAA